MSFLSVSGKNWILKRFNKDDVIFFKDNFLLDEITSKLLAIRKIKKDEIKVFYNLLLKFFTKSRYIE